MRKIRTTKAALPAASFSQAIAFSDLIVTGGQVGIDPETGELQPGLEAQVEQAIYNLEQVLLAADSDLLHVVKTTCFLTDTAKFEEFDKTYKKHFCEPFPARSTIGVALAGDLLFEIEAWAVIKKDVD